MRRRERIIWVTTYSGDGFSYINRFGMALRSSFSSCRRAVARQVSALTEEHNDQAALEADRNGELLRLKCRLVSIVADYQESMTFLMARAKLVMV